MSDWYQRAAERMAMEIATDSDAYALMATRRVRAVQADSGAMPTAEDYRLALVQCVVEKAADWRAACESARLASAEIALASAEITRLRAEFSGSRKHGETGQPLLSDAEQADLQTWLAECLRQCSTATEGGSDELAERWQGRAARAAAMLERLGGGR